MVLISSIAMTYFRLCSNVTFNLDIFDLYFRFQLFGLMTKFFIIILPILLFTANR